MQEHELVSRFATDHFLRFLCDLELSGRVVFNSDEDRVELIRFALGLCEMELRRSVAHERSLWSHRVTHPIGN